MLSGVFWRNGSSTVGAQFDFWAGKWVILACIPHGSVESGVGFEGVVIVSGMVGC